MTSSVGLRPAMVAVVALSVGCIPDTRSSPVALPEVNLTLLPSSATVNPGQAQAFAAQVWGAPEQGVLWSVEEGEAGGTISPSGLYTPPSAPGTYHIVAAAEANLDRLGSAAVVVTDFPQISVQLTPQAVALLPGQAQSFDVAVTNTSNTAVTWRVLQGVAGGAVTSSGEYVAPQAPGLYHVVATAVADGSKVGIATISVVPPSSK